jgi:hypothetical protein
MNERPLGVTILSLLAGIAGVFATVHLLQALSLLPYFIGPFAVLDFSLWGAIMWGLMIWVWFWLAEMLLRVDPQAWSFLVLAALFNLGLNFVYLVGRSEWSDVSISFLLNAIILVYCLLPNVRKAFSQG